MKTTKEKIYAFPLLPATGKRSQAQPFQKAEIATDPVREAILERFISDSENTHYFIHNNGPQLIPEEQLKYCF